MKDFTRIVELSAKISNPQNRRILERGLVWDYVTIPDVSINPTLKNNYQRVLSENNSDVFTVKISDLVPGSYPFFRAYVITEDNETIYSDIEMIQGGSTANLPLIPAPSSSTSKGSDIVLEAPKFILNYSAGAGGDIDGPSLQIVDKGDEGEAVIAIPISGYKFVAWSDGSTDKTRVDSPVDSNVVVIAQFELVCSQPQVTYYDFTYNTVAIGEQCWLKENLRTTKTASGDLIMSYCYNGDDRSCSTYGRLYPWASLGVSDGGSNSNPSGIQSICPNGWHLPSTLEWGQLIAWVSGDGGVNVGSEGKSLKASSYRWEPDTGTDDFGFAALPGGRRSTVSGYIGIKNLANFWSSTYSGDNINPLIFSLTSDSDEASNNSKAFQTDYLSLRCVQN